MSNKNFKNQNYHNYNQYGNKTESTQVEEKEKTKEVIAPTDADIAPVEEADDVLIEDTEETEETNVEVQTKPAYGIVNCSKLNVRKGPSKNTDSLCVVDIGSKLEVEPFNEEWIKVTTADGVSGYCMLEFVDIE